MMFSAYLDGGTALSVGQGDGREGSEDNRETHFDGLEIIGWKYLL